MATGQILGGTNLSLIGSRVLSQRQETARADIKRLVKNEELQQSLLNVVDQNLSEQDLSRLESFGFKLPTSLTNLTEQPKNLGSLEEIGQANIRERQLGNRLRALQSASSALLSNIGALSSRQTARQSTATQIASKPSLRERTTSIIPQRRLTGGFNAAR